MISHARLLELISYDPETGVITRNDGRPASATPSPEGYLRIWLDGRGYLQHRIAWFYAHGEWPAVRVDHKDLRRSNNRLSNLRNCDISENLMNAKAHRDNTSGFKGVTRNKKRWSASIQARGESKYLGTFDTPELAHAAYAQAAAQFHGEFARP